MAFGVYGILFPENYIYVGSTIANFDTRHRVHLRALKDNKHDNNKMQELWNKYQECEFIILEESFDKDEVRELEQYYIEQLGKEYKLCNEAPALIDGNPLSDLIKEKISEGRKRQIRGGRRKIKTFAPSEEQVNKGIDPYHKKLFEMRKEQGW